MGRDVLGTALVEYLRGNLPNLPSALQIGRRSKSGGEIAIQHAREFVSLVICGEALLEKLTKWIGEVCDDSLEQLRNGPNL